MNTTASMMIISFRIGLAGRYLRLEIKINLFKMR